MILSLSSAKEGPSYRNSIDLCFLSFLFFSSLSISWGLKPSSPSSPYSSIRPSTNSIHVCAFLLLCSTQCTHTQRGTHT